MGSAAVKMGVVAGPPMESPDVMYDLKERVHRTPYVRGSAVPSPTRLHLNQEQDLMVLTNGTVIRIQAKLKDGSKGINLYKRNLKSVPRELFYHPLAEEVTWLNLASNSLVYNKNGIFKDIDKVEENYHKDDSDIEEEREDEESSRSKASSRSSSASRKSSAKEEEDVSPVLADNASTKEADVTSVHSEAIGDVEAAAKAIVEAEGSPGQQIVPESTAPEETNASLLPEISSSEKPIQQTEEADIEKQTSEVILAAEGGEIVKAENTELPEAAPEVQAEEPSETKPAVDPSHDETEAEAKEVTPVEVIEPQPVQGEVPEAAPAENVTETGLDEGIKQNLSIKPDDLVCEDVLSEVSSVVDMGQDSNLEDSKDKDAIEKPADEKKPDVQPVREDDTNIEDFDGVAHIRAPKSVAESVDISDFEVEDEEAIEDAEKKTTSPNKEKNKEEKDEVKNGSKKSCSSSSSSSDSEDEEEEERKEEERELMSDEEGDLHDEEGNIIPRQANTLPNRFHKMPNLEELHLGYYGKGNPLKTLPNSVYSLQHLRKLDASSCRLTELPSEINRLTSIEELWLSGNFLTSLPKSIGDLKKLKSLWINYNQLNGIPATLEFCESLEGIYAHGNQIEFLSTALCRIPKLKHLGAGRNRIKFLPKNIGEMVNLEEAWLNDNHIRELPDSMFELQNLKTLWMSSNQLTSLDKKVGKLSELSELSLSKNRLTTLPSSLANCTRLRVLQLDDNKLVALPKSLNNLGYLEELWLNGNAVKEIPEGLYMISNMRKPV